MATEKILYTDNLRSGTDKINAAIDAVNKSTTDATNSIVIANSAKVTAGTAVAIADNAVDTVNEGIQTMSAKADETQTQVDTLILENGASDAEVLQARGTEDLLYKRLDKTDTKLSDSEKQIKPYNYIDYGMAFDSNDPTLVEYDFHASWSHGNVAYDTTDDKVIVFYDIKNAHVITGNRVLMRKKDVEGGFSLPFVVADRIAEGISCKSQAGGIAKNGDYVNLVAHINNSTGAILGTWIYRSVDKGVTWTSTEMLIGGNPVKAHSGDVTGFLVLDNGRILTLACVDGTRLMTVMYSDNHGSTWSLSSVPTQYNHSEPAWCELSDGTIICYLRADVNMVFSSKVPARFMKSVDGGLSWLASTVSTSILDFTNSNGHLISHRDTKTVEFIHHSRFTQIDGFGSLYVSVASEENAKNDAMGEQVRISKLSPQDIVVDTSVGNYTGDAGYIGAAKSKSGVITAFYYNGNTKNSQICYLVGKKSLDNTPVFEVNPYTGIRVNPQPTLLPLTSDKWERGTLTTTVGVADSLSASNIRLRLKDFVKVQNDKQYSMANDNLNFKASIRQYDANFILLSDSGWRNDYTFTTSTNTKYIKSLIAHATDTNIVTPELYKNLFTLNRTVFEREKRYLYDNGSERGFFTGAFVEKLKVNTGLSVKNAGNIELSVINSAGGTDGVAMITQDAINISGYSKLKVNVNVSGIIGSGEASLRIFNKAAPTNGGDGRTALSPTTSNGKQTLTVDLTGIAGSVYPAMFVNTTAAAGSVNAKFYEMWLE